MSLLHVHSAFQSQLSFARTVSKCLLQLTSVDKLISQVMATVSQSKKRYIAFYTADHSSSQKPHIQVFESRREAPAYFYNNYMDDNSNATGTVCALMDNGTSTANGGRCAMMCLKTPIYLVDLTSSGKIHMVNDTAESIRFIDGLVEIIVNLSICM